MCNGCNHRCDNTPCCKTISTARAVYEEECNWDADEEGHWWGVWCDGGVWFEELLGVEDCVEERVLVGVCAVTRCVEERREVC